MMTVNQNNKMREQFGKGPHDTGSIELQVALLTERINQLNQHFGAHSKDYASKRGLMKLVGRRRRFLKYLQKNNEALYSQLLKELNLRG
ncbi:MAG TPA: 30S ribosomal protein S15 [Candidatus Babeliaceae bacterium]|nr:30S ribosomal protein S15 [Candidatus Babeliaceae bacterium]